MVCVIGEADISIIFFYPCEKKTRTLREKMDSIRIVNRAKWLLIERLGMTEQDAHGYIEKEAMNRRRTSREIAEEIIRMYEN